jgi:hypothetical protein
MGDDELVARARQAALPSEYNVVAETSIPQIETTGNPDGKHVVVLGDDPKPRPPPSTRRGRPAGRGQGDNGLYNHCKISRQIRSESSKLLGSH